MNIARPLGGFKISLSGGVQRLVDQRCEASDEFSRFWRDIVDRLRFVAHVEGVADGRFANGSRLWVAAGDDVKGLPRIKLIYLVLGDRVTIQVASFG